MDQCGGGGGWFQDDSKGTTFIVHFISTSIATAPLQIIMH